jgi:hypothetical protein
MIRLFARRKHAYERLFRTDEHGAPLGDTATVLADLKRFAGLPNAPIATGPVGVDTIATGVRIGRQEVVNRILSYVHVDERAFFNLREDNTDD